MEANVNACMCIYVPDQGSGAGVIVHRYSDVGGAPTTTVLVATAAHVVRQIQMIDVVFMDASQIKYTDVRVLLIDETYDLAIVRVNGVPTNIPVASLAPTQPRTPLAAGTPVYLVGWPGALDMHSISKGVVRSGAWSIEGTTAHLIVDAPVMGGNSGGGVFSAVDNKLVGVVSWGLNGKESFNGVVAGWHIGEALAQALSRFPSATSPADPLFPVEYGTRNDYVFGVATLAMRAEWMADDMPEHPVLSKYGLLGSTIYLRHVGTAAMQPFRQWDVLWALSSGLEDPDDTSKWILLTQDVSLEMALHRIAMQQREATYRTTAEYRRRVRAALALRRPISQIRAPPPVDNDPLLPEFMRVHIFYSPGYSKLLLRATKDLERRHAFIDRYGVTVAQPAEESPDLVSTLFKNKNTSPDARPTTTVEEESQHNANINTPILTPIPTPTPTLTTSTNKTIPLAAKILSVTQALSAEKPGGVSKIEFGAALEAFYDSASSITLSSNLPIV